MYNLNNLIKTNINKIDNDLKNLFENVYIKEKANGKNFYFEIKANSKFFNLNESKDYKRAEADVMITKTDICSDMIKWSYSVNPLNESAHRINRTSPLNTIAKDIYDTIATSKLESEYFNALESIVELINEENISENKLSETDKIKNIFAKVNSVITPVNEIYSFTENCLAGKKCIYNFSGKLSFADKFHLESELNKLSKVQSVLFKENNIIINY